MSIHSRYDLPPVGTLYSDGRALLVAGGLMLICLASAVLIGFVQKPALLNYLYPAATLIVGGWLYVSHPPLYLGFVFWIWFITSFFRRFIDYQVGVFDPISLTSLAPIVVVGFPLASLVRFGARLKEPLCIPYLLCFSGVIYGYLVGAVKVGVLSASYALLDYLLPLVLGFHIMVLWRDYPANRDVIRSTFTWALIIIGTYALFQFFYPPRWDMKWLVESGMTGSMGRPMAHEFRVFGTLPSTGPFAKIMMAGLLVAMTGKGVVSRLALVPGYASMGLSLVRAAWGGWLVGLVYIALRYGSGKRTRILATIGLCAIVGATIFYYGPGATRVESRIGTLANIEEDASLNARLRLYRSASGDILTNPVGRGIGALGKAAKLSSGEIVNFDSGILGIPIMLGWPGSLLYLGGLWLLIRKAVRVRASQTDDFTAAAVGIVIAHLALMLFADQLKGLAGMTLWTFLSLAIAAQLYYASPIQSDEQGA